LAAALVASAELVVAAAAGAVIVGQAAAALLPILRGVRLAATIDAGRAGLAFRGRGATEIASHTVAAAALFPFGAALDALLLLAIAGLAARAVAIVLAAPGFSVPGDAEREEGRANQPPEDWADEPTAI